MKTVTFDEMKYKLVPLEPTAQMRIDAGDIGDGYELASDQVIRIFQAVLAVVPDQDKRSCSTCDDLGDLYGADGTHLGPCPECNPPIAKTS